MHNLVTNIEFMMSRVSRACAMSISKVMAGKRHERPANCSPAIYDLLCRCWDSIPSRRPNFDEIVIELEYNWKKQLKAVSSDRGGGGGAGSGSSNIATSPAASGVLAADATLVGRSGSDNPLYHYTIRAPPTATDLTNAPHAVSSSMRTATHHEIDRFYSSTALTTIQPGNTSHGSHYSDLGQNRVEGGDVNNNGLYSSSGPSSHRAGSVSPYEYAGTAAAVAARKIDSQILHSMLSSMAIEERIRSDSVSNPASKPANSNTSNNSNRNMDINGCPIDGYCDDASGCAINSSVDSDHGVDGHEGRVPRRTSAIFHGYGLMRIASASAASASVDNEEGEGILPVRAVATENSHESRQQNATAAAASAADLALAAKRFAGMHASKGFNVRSAYAHLMMPQFGFPCTPSKQKFEADNARKQLESLQLDKLKTIMETAPDLLFASNFITNPNADDQSPAGLATSATQQHAVTGSSDGASTAAAKARAAAQLREGVAFWSTAQFEGMLMMQPPPPTPTTAEAAAIVGGIRMHLPRSLSERVRPLKDVLDICLTLEITLTPARMHSSFDFKPQMEMYVDPLIELIKSELDALKASVSSDADNCMELLSKMMAECRGMYDAAFRTSINEVVGGDPTAYTNMLRQCAELRSSYRSRCIKEQPSSELIPLVLMAKESIPSFKRAVESVIARAHAVLAEQGRTSGTTAEYEASNITVAYRLKALYRMIEKALTLGPRRDYPDVSNIFDVFGCIIECADYNSTAAVVAAFTAMHGSTAAGDIDGATLVISSVSDGWFEPAADGWRGLTLNVAMNETSVVFEVQVVLRAMAAARATAAPGGGCRHAPPHTERLRCLSEVVGLLGISTQHLKPNAGNTLRQNHGGAGFSDNGSSGGGGGGGGTRIADFGDFIALNPTYDLSISFAATAQNVKDLKGTGAGKGTPHFPL